MCTTGVRTLYMYAVFLHYAYSTSGIPSGTLTPWRTCCFACSSSTLQLYPRASEAVSCRQGNLASKYNVQM
jgi:hypothetical protein